LVHKKIEEVIVAATAAVGIDIAEGDNR